MISTMTAHEQRHHISEQVRLLEREWAVADSRASELEEGRSILMAEMKTNLVEAKIAKSMSAAEDIARQSEQWRGYVRRMHDARHAANLARADWRAKEREYWASVSSEASERQQMRMAR